MTENRKKHPDNNKIVAAIFMDLSEGFDSIPNYLLIAKTEAYSFGKDSTFFNSYIKCWKQSANFNNMHPMFQISLFSFS